MATRLSLAKPETTLARLPQLGDEKEEKRGKQGTPSAPGEGDARGGPAKRQREADPGRGEEKQVRKPPAQAKTPRQEDLGLVGKHLVFPLSGYPLRPHGTSSLYQINEISR